MKRTAGISRNRFETLQLSKNGLTRKKNMYLPSNLDSK